MKISLRKASTPRCGAPRGNDRRLVTQYSRRRFLHLAAGAAVLPAITQFAWAQSYPTRPITMIVALAPGSAIDVIGRVLADRMSKLLLQSIVVENVTGAEGSIGAGRVARARPDGYTIAMGAIGTQVMNGALYSLPYDVLNGFAPISPVATAPYMLFARNTMPARLPCRGFRTLAGRIADLGVEIFPRERQTPGALGAMQKADAEKWWPIIKELGIKPE